MKTALFAAALAAALVLTPAARAGMTSTGTASADGEIVGVVAAANQGELDAAGIALKKGRSMAVKKFARHMKTDHRAAKTKLLTLRIAAVDSDRSLNLKGLAKAEGEKLGKATMDEFDKTYMDAQVDDHATLLKALDEELIPKAQAAPLAAFLKDVRKTVAAHLDEAKKIQGSLAAKK